LIQNGFIVTGKRLVCADIRAVICLIDSFQPVKKILIAIASGDVRAESIQIWTSSQLNALETDTRQRRAGGDR